MELNMDSVFQKLGQSTESVEKEMGAHMKTMDSANTMDVMKLQQMMQKWSIATQLQSNTIKTIGDCIKSTVQNIR